MAINLIRNPVSLGIAIAFGAGLARFLLINRDCLEPAPTIGGFNYSGKCDRYHNRTPNST
ncbi:hypothetical protein [Planktothrix sp. PCC 11201]|uniref:hypothetical protein n=1 Tax=Planktothrix sp. PCC 11201 TaxID=1729650 RepID=UPI0009A5FF6A|nr:hypothetical protein [Planktothrix sp. PCC 11201]